MTRTSYKNNRTARDTSERVSQNGWRRVNCRGREPDASSKGTVGAASIDGASEDSSGDAGVHSRKGKEVDISIWRVV